MLCSRAHSQRAIAGATREREREREKKRKRKRERKRALFFLLRRESDSSKACSARGAHPGASLLTPLSLFLALSFKNRCVFPARLSSLYPSSRFEGTSFALALAHEHARESSERAKKGEYGDRFLPCSIKGSIHRHAAALAPSRLLSTSLLSVAVSLQFRSSCVGGELIIVLTRLAR